MHYDLDNGQKSMGGMTSLAILCPAFGFMGYTLAQERAVSHCLVNTPF